MLNTRSHITKFFHKTLLWLVLISVPVSGFAEIRLGNLKVEPSIGYEAEYNSNIYSSNTNKQSDYIHKIKPAIQISKVKDEDNYVKAGYRADVVLYAQNSGNNYQAHNPYLSFGIKTPRGVYLKGEEEYLNTEDSYGADNQYNQGIKTRRWNNQAKLILGYDFAKRYSVEGGYENFMQRFVEETNQWQDRTDHRYSAAAFYNLSEKTAVFLQYRQTKGVYNAQNDGISGWNKSTSQDYRLSDYFLGLRFKPGGKIKGEAKLGYGQKKFENESDKNGLGYNNSGSWIAETKLEYQPFDKTLLIFNLQRGYKGSPAEDTVSYIDTMAGVELKQEILNDRLMLIIGGGLGTNDYTDEFVGLPQKSFRIYAFKSGMEWRIKQWLRAGLEYEYRQRSATESYYEGHNYDNNIFTLNVNAVF
jgi:hypothetical protein